MNIRMAGPDDYELLKPMVKSFIESKTWMPQEQFAAYLQTNDQFVAIAFDEDNKAQGYIEWTIWAPSLTFSKRVCFVQSLWTEEHLRRQGIGSALIEFTCASAIKNGCPVLHLEASPGDRLKFYEKNGFKVCNSGLYRWLKYKATKP